MEMEDIDNPTCDDTTKGRQRPGDLYELVDRSVSQRNKNGGATNSRKACNLVIEIALSTAVLALVIAMVSVVLSIALNSNSEMQSIAADMKRLQVSLNQSANTIEYIGQRLSAFRTTTRTLYGVLYQRVDSIKDTIRVQSDFLNELNLKGSILNPATSCSEIPTDSPSGDYWIVGNSKTVQVYCDMTRTCCDTTGGWMRVANLDMTDSNKECPDGFKLYNETTAPLRTCGRPGPPGCVPTTFPVHGIEYSRVCGRVIGYQFGTPDAFQTYFDHRTFTINDSYVDGVSLTHGSPRKHIWTFACASNEVDANAKTCPCSRSDSTYTGVVPPFIGQDYFCDTGSINTPQFTIYPDDPLWNGQGCGDNSTCCSFNNPPWFCRQLPQSTTDDIELRLCLNQATNDEDALLELVDIFVK